MNKAAYLQGYSQKVAALMGFNDLETLANETNQPAQMQPASLPLMPQKKMKQPLKYGPGAYQPTAGQPPNPLQREIRGSKGYQQSTNKAIQDLYASRQQRQKAPLSAPLKQQELGQRGDLQSMALSGGEDYNKLEQAASPAHQKMMALKARKQSMPKKPQTGQMVSKVTPYGTIKVRNSMA